MFYNDKLMENLHWKKFLPCENKTIQLVLRGK